MGMLPKTVPVDGVVCEISAAGEALTVPVAFIYMARDLQFASKEAIEKIRAKLAARGVRSEAFEVGPFDLGGTVIHERLPEFIDAQSAKDLVEELAAMGFMDTAGKLSANPRGTKIVDGSLEFLTGRKMLKASDEQLVKDNFVELYNAAWGVHELTRERVMDAFDFLLKDRKAAE